MKNRKIIQFMEYLLNIILDITNNNKKPKNFFQLSKNVQQKIKPLNSRNCLALFFLSHVGMCCSLTNTLLNGVILCMHIIVFITIIERKTFSIALSQIDNVKKNFQKSLFIFIFGSNLMRNKFQTLLI